MNETRAQKLFKANRTFEGSKYEPVTKSLWVAYCREEHATFDKLFETLPTNIQMLDNILEKVKNKSVFRTLKKTVSETIEDRADALVGLSSLLTYVAIECKTNREYRALLPDLNTKMTTLIRQV